MGKRAKVNSNINRNVNKEFSDRKLFNKKPSNKKPSNKRLSHKELLKKENSALYLKKLKDKLRYYKQIVVNSSDAVIIQDFNGIIKAWNKRATQVYGFKEEEMLGQSILKIIAPENRAEARRNIGTIRKGKPCFRLKQTRITKDKQKVFVNITYSPLYENEEIVEIGTTEEDISKLKKSLENVRGISLRYTHLFDYMEECVVVYSVENNGKNVIIRDMNRAAEKLERVKKEEIVGKKVETVFKGVKKIGLYDAFIEVWKTGKSQHHPISFYKDKYHQGWRENYVYKLPTGEIIAIYSDVTEDKKASEKLKISELKFRRLFESAQDAILIINAHTGKIEESNPYIQKMMGYSTEELLGKQLWQISPFKDIVANKTKFVELQKKKMVHYEDLPLETKSGKKFYVEFVSNVYGINGETVVQCNIRDITDRKKIQDALKKSRENIEKQVEERTKELKESEDKYALLYRSSNDAIMTLEPPTWRFTSGNPKTIEMFKCKDEKEFISLGPWDLSPKFQPDGKLSSLKAKEMIGKAMEEGTNLFEWTHKEHHGKTFSATVLLSRIKNKHTYLQATVRDITAQKEAEKDILRAQEQLTQKVAELEKFNKITMGRELKMVELKNKIKKLENHNYN